MSERGEYHCYTDGSCKAGDGAPGGWGFFIRAPSGPPIEGYGKASGTLAKVMEYRAVAEALAALPAGVTAVVHCDNQSLVDNLTKQLATWRERAFARVDPLIVDSVRRLDATITAHTRSRCGWQWGALAQRQRGQRASRCAGPPRAPARRKAELTRGGRRSGGA